MPNLVTARLFLEDTSKGFGEARETVGALRLNEGFDRPFWAADKAGSAKMVPASSETVLIDGLFMLFQEFTDFEPDQEYLKLRDSGESFLESQDLAISDYEAAAKASLAKFSESLEVSLVVYPTSAILRRLDDLDKFQVSVNVFLQAKSTSRGE